MGFQPAYINEIEVQQPEVSKTPKTYWDHNASCWKNTTLWHVPLRRATEDWLTEHYPADRNDRILGWYKHFQKITMNDKIYLHYCLAKPE
jgi:hypothetical protein